MFIRGLSLRAALAKETTQRKNFVLVAAAAALTVAACNTVEGVGEDVEAAGEGIQEGANDAQN